MTLRELIDRFRILAQDKVRPYLWPDDELAPWFSDAESEAAIRARLVNDSAELSLTAGDNDPIALPGGLFDIQFAELRAADGTTSEITGASRRELDRLRPGWRARSERPTNYVLDDKHLIVSALPDQDYTLYIEFFRTPGNQLRNDSDTPEIAEAHHLNLVDWVLHCAYSKPDADTLNPGKSANSEADFTRYFGPRPNADLRRRQNANRPHRNTLHG